MGLHAETGRSAWLRYAELNGASLRQYRDAVPSVVASLGGAAPVESARQEVLRGIRGMLDRTLRLASGAPAESAIVLGTQDAVQHAFPQGGLAGSLEADAFWLKTVQQAGKRYVIITGANDRGVLYGAFAYLRKIAMGEPVTSLDEKQTPYAPVRS